MKALRIALATLWIATVCGRADLILVQKVEGGGQTGEQTIKIKGDKSRTDLAHPVCEISGPAVRREAKRFTGKSFAVRAAWPARVRKRSDPARVQDRR